MNAENSASQTTGSTVACFDRLAHDGRALRFNSDDGPRLERLRLRLGDLRGLHVLEPGCGAGPLTECLSRWVEPGGVVEAFDPSLAMLNLCRNAIDGRANVRLTQVNCEDAMWPAGEFDRVICFRVWPHFTKPAAVAARFARWLRPGGRLHIVHWQGRAALAAVHNTETALTGHVLPSAADLAEMLRDHGFTVASTIDTTDEFYLEAVRE